MTMMMMMMMMMTCKYFFVFQSKNGRIHHDDFEDH